MWWRISKRRRFQLMEQMYGTKSSDDERVREALKIKAERDWRRENVPPEPTTKVTYPCPSCGADTGSPAKLIVNDIIMTHGPYGSCAVIGERYSTMPQAWRDNYERGRVWDLTGWN